VNVVGITVVGVALVVSVLTLYLSVLRRAEIG
jgi:hypothetical protein